MQIEKKKISEVKVNPKNPRLIKDHKYHKLVKSIREFPEMLKIRPIVVDENNVILGGNMRYKACIEAGLKEVYVINASELSEAKKKEFVVKDNVNFGEWDYDLLSMDYEVDKLIDYGINVLYFGDEVEQVDQEQKAEIIKEMELKFNEHHDYIVFLFENSNDWVKAVSQLNLPKMPVSLSPKTKRVGLGRVVSASKLIELLNNGR